MNTPNAERSPYILAIDIGSSSTRAEVVDRRLNPVAGTFCQKSYQLITDADGLAELKPDTLLEIVSWCIGTSTSAWKYVDAIGISCFWHSILGVDANGAPTTNVLMWADTRAAHTVNELYQHLDPTDHHQRTGTRLHTSYPMAKLCWLKEHHPEVFQRTHRWMSFPEYVQHKLTGTRTVSTSMASGTGLFNRNTLDWDPEALASTGITVDQLSPLSDEPIRWTHPESWPHLHGTRWIPAIGDGAANNLGGYAVAANHPALMVGTTGALRVVTDDPPDELPPRLWQYRLDQTHALLGGALSEGGGVIAWLMDTLRTADHDALESAIAQAAPDAHGLTILPYLAGERSPNWHSDAVGTIHGIRFDTSAADIVQATMESIGYSFAAILEDLAPLLSEPVEIIATGNALRQNLTWVQMIADIAGYPLLIPAMTESSLRGAALHALWQLGAEPEMPDLRERSSRTEPRNEHAGTYATARERQAELYQLLVAR